MPTDLTQDLKYLIYSYLDLETSIIFLNNDNTHTKIMVQCYFPISQNKHKYVRSDDYYTVKYMQSIGVKFTQHSMYIASKSGSLRLVKFFVQSGIIPTQKVINGACIMEYFELLQYLYQVAPKRFSSDTLYYALHTKNKEIIYYLYNLGIHITEECIIQSISVDIEIFKLMFAKRSKKFKFIFCYAELLKADNPEIYDFLKSIFWIADSDFISCVTRDNRKLGPNFKTYFDNKEFPNNKFIY
jgi:hypothetical protein